MEGRAAGGASELTRRLLGSGAELEQRLSLAEDFAAAEHGSSVRGHSRFDEVCSFFDRLIAGKVPVLVYGDYDVDGSVSSFMLHRWLRGRSVPGNFFLPSRFKHGYGLDTAVLRQAAEQGYRALIALDCGTANLAEVAQARSDGLDVLIVDHHTPRESLPDALLINPHLEPGMPPFCTAGLVHELLAALDGVLHGSAAGDETELAGLATLADVVPLVPANWKLAHEALGRIPETLNHGLSELVKVAGLHGLTRITDRQIGFQLVPRLNAAGRMKSARLIVDLLAAAESESARQQAMGLDRLNNERKDTARLVTNAALLQALQFPASRAVALYDPQWHIGVLGIVAARVAEQQKKPAVIFSDAPGDSELLSGSARSFGGYDLVAALRHCSELLVSYGGHADAAGVKLQRQRLEEFQRAWDEAVGASEPRAEHAATEYQEVRLSEISAEFERDLWRLAPFGNGFPAPRCILRDCRVSRVSYMGRERLHLNILLEDGQRELRVAAFDSSHLYDRLRGGQEIRPLVEIEADNWNNVMSISVRLLELT